MLTAHAVRQLLAIADVRQDPYAVARVAAGLLTLQPNDPFAASHYARALATLDLGTVARRVLPNAEKKRGG